MSAPVSLGPHPGFLRDFAETRGYLLGRPQRVQPTPDGRAVLFLRSPGRVPELGLYEYDVASGETRELVTPAEILGGAAEVLTEAEKARRERQRITDRGFTGFGLAPDGLGILLVLSGQLFLFDRQTRNVRALTPRSDEPLVDPRFSPDGRRIAFVRGYDLWVLEVDDPSASARPLTAGGSENRLHGLAEFVAQEEMSRFEGYWWSPDGARIAVTEVLQDEVERFAIADPARPERPPVIFPYPRPGKANAQVRLGLLSAEPTTSGPPAPLWIEWDRARYPYLARVLWETPLAPLTLLVQTRDQREAALLAVDAGTGATRPLIVERDEAWIELGRDLPRWLPDGSGLLWGTERTGRRALELRDADGAFVRELVGDLGEGRGFLSLVHVDAPSRTVVVLVGGATTNGLARVSWDGGPPAAITADAAEHAPVFSRDGWLFVDTRVAADAWPEAVVCGADGTRRGALPHAAETPPFAVNLELVTVTGARTYHAAVVRPRDFDPGRRYPVVVHVYGGPHALMVKADARHYLLDQWIADHGAIVVCVDNRGTPRRDRAWERAIKGSFAEAPLADQADGLAALGRRFPELDLSRVGIYGWSFGGYMAALAVLRRPDVFHVAVAGAPVVDWLDYDTHYTERYLDLPAANPDGYHGSSLLPHAGALARPLLLVHGTADDNVYFFHSLKLAGALFRAGRRFDFLPLPGVTHQIGDPVVRERVWGEVARYLLAHLGAAAPT